MIEFIMPFVTGAFGAMTYAICSRIYDYFWARKCLQVQKTELPTIDRDFRLVAISLLYLGHSVDEIRQMSVWQAKITGNVKLT